MMTNKKNINCIGALYISIILVISATWIFLRLCGIFKNINILELTFFCSILFLIHRLSLLRYFKMDISETILSIDYNYLMALQYRGPVLEIPLKKISSFSIEKGVFSSFLVLSITTKKGIRNYYYWLGFLNRQKTAKIKMLLNNLSLNNDPKLQTYIF